MNLDYNQKIFFELLKAGLFPVHGEGGMVHDSQFDKKADRIMEFVMETGNFGHNRHNAYGKLISLYGKRQKTLPDMHSFSLWTASNSISTSLGME